MCNFHHSLPPSLSLPSLPLLSLTFLSLPFSPSSSSPSLFLIIHSLCRDIVKLTAQFVARNGAQFLDKLMMREQVLTIFNFNPSLPHNLKVFYPLLLLTIHSSEYVMIMNNY